MEGSFPFAVGQRQSGLWLEGIVNISAASGKSVKYHGLQRADLDGLATTRIFAAQFVIDPDAIIASLGKPGPVAFIRTRRKGRFLRAAAPFDLVLEGLAALRAVNLGRHQFIFFVEKISFFHGSQLQLQDTFPGCKVQSPLFIPREMLLDVKLPGYELITKVVFEQ
jgi:hypothetical protein